MAKAQQSIIVDVPSKHFFEVVVDYARYPEFLPEVKKIDILERRKNHAIVGFEIDVLRRITYSISVIEKPYKSVEWKLHESPFFKENNGGWYLTPMGRSKTEVTYMADLALPLLIPKSITNMLLQVRLPKMLELFKGRAQSIANKTVA